jgi:hypothetical protein
MKFVSRDLGDLVSIVTAAYRVQRGGLVWLCYNGSSGPSKKSKAKEKPEFGSTLIAVSAWTARVMKARFDELFAPGYGHFDLSLLHCLEQHEFARIDLQACYVWPSIGHYTTHKSGCQEGLGIRQSAWDAHFVQEGVRPLGGNQRHRCLRAFGSGEVICTVQLPPPPGVDLRWFTSLRSRRSGAEPFAAYHHAKELQPGRKGDLCIIDAPGLVEQEPLDTTKRRKRQLRATQSDYGHRLFVEDAKAPRD